ncbi:MAG: hypothetical protein HZA32_06750 [Opitutae bacterium]|nr:hypothetical protein [Opitutae bacterium]
MSASESGRTWHGRLENALAHRASPWLLLAALAALFTWAYATHELNPGDSLPAARRGWWSWADQTKYIEAAQMLAGGRVDAQGYYYPLGYSALAAPFARVMPTQPFFWPNLACVLIAAACAWRLARRWLSRVATLACATAFIALHASLLRLTMVVPWNTLPTTAALIGGILLVLARRDGAAVGWLALVAALTYWVRPSDAACFAPLLVFAVLRLPSWAARGGWGVAGVALIGASAGAMAWLNVRTFGHWRTPYEQGSFENIGFLSYPILHKAYALLVDGETFFGEYGSALLWRYPWLFLAVPGAVFWVKRDGAAAVACLATIGLNWFLYFNYNDFVPSAVFRFSLIHYISWAFVPLAIAATAAAICGWRDRGVRWAGLAAVVLFAGAIGLKLKERTLHVAVAAGEVRALPPARPLWVKFPGAKPESVTGWKLDERSLREAFDYQVPYAPVPELRVMLSENARGLRLAPDGAKVTAAPLVGDFEWSWWPRWRRLAPPRD